MKKRDFTADFSSIKKMCSKIRNINEAMSYADEYDEDMPQGEEYDGEEQQPQQGTPQGFNPDGYQGDQESYTQQAPQGYDEGEDDEEEELDAETNDPESPVNQIREIALRGMVALCKTPEDPQYEVLKKIFQFCDKANDKKKDED